MICSQESMWKGSRFCRCDDTEVEHRVEALKVVIKLADFVNGGW